MAKLIAPFLILPLVLATAPGIPYASTARSELSELTVAPAGSQEGYDRDLFPHWITRDGYETIPPYILIPCIGKITRQLYHP